MRTGRLAPWPRGRRSRTKVEEGRARARKPRALDYDDLFRLREASKPSLGPDGTVAFVVTSADRDADENRSSIWSVRCRRRAEAAHPGAERRRARSGRRTARSSRSCDAPDGPPQIWLLPDARGRGAQADALSLGASGFEWSPDGKRLAVTAVVDLDGDPEDDKEKQRRATAPRVITDTSYKADGAGLIGSKRVHLFVVDASPAMRTTLIERRRQRVGTRVVAGRQAHRVRRVARRPRVVDALAPLRRRRVRQGQAEGDGRLGRLGRRAVLVVRRQDARLRRQPRGRAGTLAAVRRRRRRAACSWLRTSIATSWSGARPTPALRRASSRTGRSCSARATAGARTRTRCATAPSRRSSGTRRRSSARCRPTASRSRAWCRHPTIPADVFLANTDGSAQQRLTDLNADWLADVKLHRCEPRTFTAADGLEVHGWVMAGTGAKPRPLAPRHPRRAPQRVEPDLRRRAPLPRDPRDARVEHPPPEPARLGRLRREVHDRRHRRLGRLRRAGLHRRRSTVSSTKASPIRSASPCAATATAGS